MITRHIALGFALLSLAGAAGAEKPTRAEFYQTSWGKPGVSLEDYRIDAGVCAWRATNLDISGTKAAQTMVKASRALDHPTYASRSFTFSNGSQATISAAIDMRNVEDRYRVDKQFDAIADVQYDSLFQCLQQRGYRKFQLTEGQAKQLRKLRHGTLQRHIYLHQLASDPAVLSRQAL